MRPDAACGSRTARTNALVPRECFSAIDQLLRSLGLEYVNVKSSLACSVAPGRRVRHAAGVVVGPHAPVCRAVDPAANEREAPVQAPHAAPVEAPLNGRAGSDLLPCMHWLRYRLSINVHRLAPASSPRSLAAAAA